MQLHLRARFALGLALANTGSQACLSPPDPPSAGISLPTLSAYDARGTEVALSALPRRPRFELRAPQHLAPDATLPWLFTGACDPSLQRDLERLPLTAASNRRLVALDVQRTERALTLAPLTTLASGASYTLAWPHLAADGGETWSVQLQVEASPLAGALLHATFPAAEASDVPVATRSLIASFDGEVSGEEAGLWLEDAAGYALPASLQAAACEDLDTAAHSCTRIAPDIALEPASRYTIRSGRALSDAHGAEIESFASNFSTAVAPAGPSFQELSCALDEIALPGGCALASDTALELRLSPSASTRVTAELDGRRIAQLPRADGRPNLLRWDGLTPRTRYTLHLQYADLLAATRDIEHAFTTEAELPTLSISELRADPAGPERTQEYVELWNFGSRTQTLAGCALSDAANELGTSIASEVSLAPGARALLVPDDFDPGDALDAPPAPGTALVRMGKSLTRSGLSNTGEPLFLRDPAQRRLSAAPAIRAPPGECSSRVGGEPRSARPEDFATMPCTPGS